MTEPAVSSRPTETRAGKLYRGEVAYISAFDLAYDMRRERVSRILSEPTQDYCIGADKPSPKYVFFYRPRMVALPSESYQGPYGTIEVRRTVKLFNVGAISIQVRVPFKVERIEDLVAYHDLSFGETTLEGEVNRLAEQVRKDVSSYCISPAASLIQVEAYTAFCIYELPETADNPKLHAEQWLGVNHRAVAGLLTQEEDPANLSDQEAEESTGQYLSYYYQDLVVADWDAALVVGQQDNLDDVLHIIELANVQLVELSTYDRILDESPEMAYRDVAKLWMPVRREVYRRLREICVDLARFSDELSNTTKFFGDWHLARIYENVIRRFHLADWQKVIDEKIKTLGDFYQILQQDRTNRLMVALEAAIVLLFIIDVLLLLWGR